MDRKPTAMLQVLLDLSNNLEAKPMDAQVRSIRALGRYHINKFLYHQEYVVVFLGRNYLNKFLLVYVNKFLLDYLNKYLLDYLIKFLLVNLNEFFRDKDIRTLRVDSLVAFLLTLFKLLTHGEGINPRLRPMRCQFRPPRTL